MNKMDTTSRVMLWYRLSLRRSRNGYQWFFTEILDEKFNTNQFNMIDHAS